MAESGVFLSKNQFRCAICLDVLEDPVTIPCGQSYCMGCIKGCWDQDDHTGVYSCPQCRETFTPRPVLNRNTILAATVDKLKKMGLQATRAAHCYAGPGDVACDVCTERKRKAIKSCLVCLASYCQTHLQPHYESPPLKKHKLVQATGQLQDKICSCHDKLLEVYCRTEQQCICLLCTMDEHRGHDTVSVVTERTEKQKQLGETQKKAQQRIQEREKELQDLRQAVESLTRSAQAAVEDSERIFTELIRSIERRRSEVKELIRKQEKAAVSRAEGLLERLEQEIAELKRRDTELEQLSHTEDHIHFLQSCNSLSDPPGPGDLPSITFKPHFSFEAVRKSISVLKVRLEDVCKVEMSKISSLGSGGDISGSLARRGGSSGGGATAAEKQSCPICMKSIKKKQRLMCSHELCADCLKSSAESSALQCPVCHQPLRVMGDQPEGTMNIRHRMSHIFITYRIPGGIQKESHPNPGKPFSGLQYEARLPANQKGGGMLKLLQRAFDQKLVFTVATVGAEDKVIFNDIPHTDELGKCYGPNFWKRVKDALRAKGIK